MTTISVAAIIIAFIAAVSLLLISINNKQKRIAMKQLLQRFHQLGSDHNVTFSSQEMLKDSLMGLDGLRRKLLIVRKDGHQFQSLVLNLDEVKTCSVKKQYGTIFSGDMPTNKLDQYLEQIILHFELHPDQPPVEVLFYHHYLNHVFEIAELERKARHWEAILSKIVAPLKKIA